jgi:uncharacterized protein DUF1559
LLPAVQQAREAARRTQCRNNMHQLVLALHNYHDAHSTFPMGQGPYLTGLWNEYSWGTALLPYLDEAALFNAYNHSRAAHYDYDTTRTNTTVVRSVLAQYWCPSDSDKQFYYAWGQTCYAACGGSGSAPYFYSTVDGLFFHLSRIRIRHIDDGTSQTIAFGEINAIRSDKPMHSAHYCPRSWGCSYVGRVMRGTGSPINSSPGSADPPGSSGRPCYLNSFGSRHEGGAFFCFADGQVRFLSENIDSTTFRALGSRDGNEIVDDEDY